MSQNKKFFDYYMSELSYLNQAGKEFAHNYPQVADALQIDINQYGDPHLKKLVQAFAFLTARVQQKIDNQFNQIPNQLLQILYPHISYDTPPLSIMHFITDKDMKEIQLEKGTILKQNGFKTQLTQSIDFSNTKISKHLIELGSSYNLKHNLVLKLELQNIDKNSLRFYINTPYHKALQFYSYLFSEQNSIYIIKDNVPIKTKLTLKKSNCNIYPDYKYEDKRLHSLASFLAYYQSCMFFEIEGLENIDTNSTLLISLNTNKAQTFQLKEHTLLLNCAPAANLFENNTLPLKITYETATYPIHPQNQNNIIHSVQSVENYKQNQENQKTFHHLLEAGQEAYWISSQLENKQQISFFEKTLDLDSIPNQTVCVKTLEYNKNIHTVKQNTIWSLNKPIAGLTCINLEKFSSPIKAQHEHEYKDLIKLLHTNITSKTFFEKPLDFIKKLIHTHMNLNTNHTNLENLIEDVQIETDSVYKKVGKILAPAPRLNITLYIQNNDLAFVFAKMISEVFAQNIPLNYEINFNIK